MTSILFQIWVGDGEITNYLNYKIDIEKISKYLLYEKLWIFFIISEQIDIIESSSL